MLNIISVIKIGEEHCCSCQLSHQRQTLHPSFHLMNLAFDQFLYVQIFWTTESLSQVSLSIPTSLQQFSSNKRPFTLLAMD